MLVRVVTEIERLGEAVVEWLEEQDFGAVDFEIGSLHVRSAVAEGSRATISSASSRLSPLMPTIHLVDDLDGYDAEVCDTKPPRPGRSRSTATRAPSPSACVDLLAAG